MSLKPKKHTKTPPRTSLARSLVRGLVIGVVLLWSIAAVILVAVRWVEPPTTAMQMQRRLEAWIHHTPYHKRYRFIPLNEISPDLQHAVIAAEDAHFYQHHGFDWEQIQIAAREDLEGNRTRGASTITQQLVKNLFFGTSRSVLRKGAEATLVPVAEFVLGKQRILEIYLNVVEWGPGIYGAEPACRYYDRTAGPEYQPGAGGPACCCPARSPEATTGAHEQLQYDHSYADGPDGMVGRAREWERQGARRQAGRQAACCQQVREPHVGVSAQQLRLHSR